MDTSSLTYPTRSSPFSMSATYSSNPILRTTSSVSAPGSETSTASPSSRITDTNPLTALYAPAARPMSAAGGSKSSWSGVDHVRSNSAMPSGCGIPSTHGRPAAHASSFSRVPGPIFLGGVLMIRCKLTVSRELKSTRRYATRSLISLRV